MRRRLFTAVSVLSLVVCLLFIASWLRSYWVADDLRRISYAGGGTVAECGVAHVRGRWGLVSVRYQPSPPAARAAYRWDRPSAGDAMIDRGTLMRWLGFGLISLNRAGTAGWRVWMPHWPFVLLTSLLPSTAWALRRRRRLLAYRQSRRMCLHCGYNLTGNTSGVCPECGTQTTAGVKA
jgi:hypothetical protein